MHRLEPALEGQPTLQIGASIMITVVRVRVLDTIAIHPSLCFSLTLSLSPSVSLSLSLSTYLYIYIYVHARFWGECLC